eukprot:384111-Rhodomonas_salina.7
MCVVSCWSPGRVGRGLTSSLKASIPMLSMRNIRRCRLRQYRTWHSTYAASSVLGIARQYRTWHSKRVDSGLPESEVTERSHDSGSQLPGSPIYGVSTGLCVGDTTFQYRTSRSTRVGW